VHPGLPGSGYPFGELCGAGVAFKLAWRLATTWCGSQRVSKPLQQTLLDMLPLVALGTIADVVPLVDENRVLASFGLRWIKQTPLVGLRALIEASGLADEQIDSEKVGFVLGPRLNACGRMGHVK
jgi:single-stranded-DNA-specific exonuclease